MLGAQQVYILLTASHLIRKHPCDVINGIFILYRKKLRNREL